MNQHTEGSQQAQSTQLPRTRFAAPGPRSINAARLATIAAGVAACIALAAVAVAALRPLPEARSAQPDPPRIPQLAQQSPGDADRADLTVQLAPALARRHAFSAWRRPINELPAEHTAANAAQGDQAAEPNATAAGPSQGRPRETTELTTDEETVVVEVDAIEDLDDEARKSLETMALRGIFTRRSGDLAAMFSFTHAASKPARTVQPGESFPVPRASNDKAEPLEWTLLGIDDARDRVLLRQGDYTVAVALFNTGEVDLSPFLLGEAGRAAEAAGLLPPKNTPIAEPSERIADDGTVVVERDPREVMRQLQEEGHELDIAEIFKLMALDIQAERTESTSDAESADTVGGQPPNEQ
jgi:hypothetical protein